MKNYFENMSDSDLLYFYKEWNISEENNMMKQHQIIQDAISNFKNSTVPPLICKLEMLSEISKRWHNQNV